MKFQIISKKHSTSPHFCISQSLAAMNLLSDSGHFLSPDSVFKVLRCCFLFTSNTPYYKLFSLGSNNIQCRPLSTYLLDLILAFALPPGSDVFFSETPISNLCLVGSVPWLLANGINDREESFSRSK